MSVRSVTFEGAEAHSLAPPVQNDYDSLFPTHLSLLPHTPHIPDQDVLL